MNLSSVWSEIAKVITQGGSTTATAVQGAIQSVLGSKFAAIETTVTNLQNAGPGADPNELAAMFTTLTNQMASASGLPQAEFSLVTSLKSLAGTTTPAAETQWQQTCQQINALLSTASSSIL